MRDATKHLLSGAGSTLGAMVGCILVFLAVVAFGSSLVSAASTVNAEDQGGVSLLGYRKLIDLNTTADQAIVLNLGGASRYYVERILVTDATGSLALAAGGIYTAPGKAGIPIVASSQAYSALTASTKVLQLTVATTDVHTAGTLYFSLSVAAGSAATASVFVIGYPLP